MEKYDMKAFKTFLVTVLTIALVNGCGLLCKQKQPATYGASMRILYDRDFTYEQFDSICAADTIPLDLKLWKAYTARDYETDSLITEYMYIKRLGAGEELFRLMVKNGDKYNIYKRVTYGNKEE